MKKILGYIILKESEFQKEVRAEAERLRKKLDVEEDCNMRLGRSIVKVIKWLLN